MCLCVWNYNSAARISSDCVYVISCKTRKCRTGCREEFSIMVNPVNKQSFIYFGKSSAVRAVCGLSHTYRPSVSYSISHLMPIEKPLQQTTWFGSAWRESRPAAKSRLMRRHGCTKCYEACPLISCSPRIAGMSDQAMALFQISCCLRKVTWMEKMSKGFSLSLR